MSTSYEFRANIKATIMMKLYNEQLEYWNDKLFKLSQENAKSLGRVTNAAWNQYAIYFNNKAWGSEWLDWDDSEPTSYCVELNPAYPLFHERMVRIAGELQELHDERYETERFLSGFVLFNASPAIFRKILGSTLYNVVQKELESHQGELTEKATNKSILEYANKNVRIIKAMYARLMINLISTPY